MEDNKNTELPEAPKPLSAEAIARMAEKIEKEIDQKKTTEDLDQNLEELEESNGKDASEEVDLGDLEYADGKERDEVDLIEEEEKIYGVDILSPFKTADRKVLNRRLESMTANQKRSLCERVGGRVVSTEDQLDAELNRTFNDWLSLNGSFQTTASKKAEKGARSEAFEGSESVKGLEEKLKSKTLSDLQATAARLGFNPGFDKDRLVTLIKQEYQRQN